MSNVFLASASNDSTLTQNVWSSPTKVVKSPEVSNKIYLLLAPPDLFPSWFLLQGDQINHLPARETEAKLSSDEKKKPFARGCFVLYGLTHFLPELRQFGAAQTWRNSGKTPEKCSSAAAATGKDSARVTLANTVIITLFRLEL